MRFENVWRHQVDIVRILSIQKRNNFDGVIIPDPTPQMSCPGPWHAGMTHTLGFVLGAIEMLKPLSPERGDQNA
jgi:mannonate dehydratase